MAVDLASSLLTFLSNQWNTALVDNQAKPQFVKITDLKTFTYNTNPDIVAAQRPMNVQSPAGLGGIAKAVKRRVNLDVRTIVSESHFYKLQTEVLRILDTNLTNAISGVDELNPDNSTQQDMSDKRQGVWRIIIPVELISWNVTR